LSRKKKSKCCCEKESQCECKKDRCCEKECGPAETLVSARDPTTIATGTPGVIDLTGWTNVVSDVLNSFDDVTGTYCPRCPGDYEFNVVLNYRSSIPLPIENIPGPCGNLNVGSSIPRVLLYDPCTGEEIAASQFPVVSIVICIPPLSTGELPVEVTATAIDIAAAIPISTIVPLKCGQCVRVAVDLKDITLPPGASITFSPPGNTTTFTAKKIRNTPSICYEF